MKKLSLFLGAILASVFLQAYDNQDVLIVGTTSGYAPYVSLNNIGEYEGFDIDLARALATKLKRRLEIKDLGSMPSLLLALQQKKVDVVIWAVSITEERKKNMRLVYYQGKKQQTTPFLFWKKIPPDIASIEDLSGQTVVVEAGSYQEAILQRYPKICLKYVDRVFDAILEIKYQKALTTTVDPALVQDLCGRVAELQVLSLPLPLEEQSEGNGIAINKDNVLLERQVFDAVSQLREEGQIAAFEKKWGLWSIY